MQIFFWKYYPNKRGNTEVELLFKIVEKKNEKERPLFLGQRPKLFSLFFVLSFTPQRRNLDQTKRLSMFSICCCWFFSVSLFIFNFLERKHQTTQLIFKCSNSLTKTRRLDQILIFILWRGNEQLILWIMKRGILTKLSQVLNVLWASNPLIFRIAFVYFIYKGFFRRSGWEDWIVVSLIRVAVKVSKTRTIDLYFWELFVVTNIQVWIEEDLRDNCSSWLHLSI